jgi:predicted dinucleotide-utilizing enzyme
MANHQAGEAELAAGGLGRFTLVFTSNALAEIQSAFALGTGATGDQQFLDRLFHLPVAMHHDLRIALLHALQAKHSDRVRDLYEAGVVMDAAGLAAVRKAIAQALVAGFPSTTQDETSVGASPPKAQSPGAGSE